MNSAPPSPTLWTAVVFAIAIAVVNGLARFSYALLLPVMRTDLGWSYAQAGWLNNANALGYGLGALLGVVLLSRYRASTLFVAGLVMATFSLLVCGYTRELGWMMLWRLVAGIGSAWVFACGGSLVAAHYSASVTRSAAAVTIFYAGGGLGIALSGVLLWPVLESVWSWPAGWLVLGFASMLLSIWPARLALRLGGQQSRPSAVRLPWLQYRPILLAYFLFGAGYIVYLTFVVAWMREMQLGTAQSVSVWVLMGFAVMSSGYVWRGVMGRWWPGRTFAAACLCTGLGTALPLLALAVPSLRQSLALLLLSSVVVGGSFFMAPSAIMALTRQTLPSTHWAKMMNLFTFAFAIGQAIGPVAAGMLADWKNLNIAMMAGASVLLLAALIALAQRQQHSVK